MPGAEEKYRRLPGRKRGLGTSASLWMGSDHILLVKSAWFREEYKRFYLRDIQAVVVAPCARFYVSTPMLLLAVAWMLPALSIAAWPDRVAGVWALGGLALAATWLAISIGASCRCRLYTAVSKDDLPSLYRTWTARRFLRQIQPRIEQVQGVVDAGWAEAERTEAGPAVAAMAPVTPPPRPAGRAHTLLSDLFALSLVVGALVGLATVRSADTAWFQLRAALTLVQLAGAIAVLVQYARGTLSRTMQRVAIAALVLIGVTFYVQTFSFAFVSTARMGAVYGAAGAMPEPVIVIHQVSDAVRLLLGFISAVNTLRSSYEDEPDIIKD
jgi:hypothetical protein